MVTLTATVQAEAATREICQGIQDAVFAVTSDDPIAPEQGSEVEVVVH